MPKRLAVIPARKGSKGIPGKNKMEINGLSLTMHAAICAHRAGCDVVISTDDDYREELDYVQHQCPRIRIEQRDEILCTDTALAWDVWQSVYRVNKVFNYDTYLYLEPTSPIRS